jgi:hypothetical protein
MKRTWLLIPIAAAWALACPRVGRAQYRNPYNNMTWNNSFSRMVDMTNSMNQSLMSQMNRINLSRSLALRGSAGASTAPAAPSTAAPGAAHRPLSATDFKPADRNRPVLDRFVGGIELEPADRAGLKQALEQTIRGFEKETRRNNVATSFGIALVAAVHVANGQDIADAQSEELVATLNDAMSSSTQWKQMSARDKQTLSDAMLVYTAMMMQLAARPEPEIKQVSVTMAKGLLAQLAPATH